MLVLIFILARQRSHLHFIPHFDRNEVIIAEIRSARFENRDYWYALIRSRALELSKVPSKYFPSDINELDKLRIAIAANN